MVAFLLDICALQGGIPTRYHFFAPKVICKVLAAGCFMSLSYHLDSGPSCSNDFYFTLFCGGGSGSIKMKASKNDGRNKFSWIWLWGTFMGTWIFEVLAYPKRYVLLWFESSVCFK